MDWHLYHALEEWPCPLLPVQEQHLLCYNKLRAQIAEAPPPVLCCCVISPRHWLPPRHGSAGVLELCLRLHQSHYLLMAPSFSTPGMEILLRAQKLFRQGSGAVLCFPTLRHRMRAECSLPSELLAAEVSAVSFGLGSRPCHSSA